MIIEMFNPPRCDRIVSHQPFVKFWGDAPQTKASLNPGWGNQIYPNHHFPTNREPGEKSKSIQIIILSRESESVYKCLLSQQKKKPANFHKSSPGIPTGGLPGGSRFQPLKGHSFVHEKVVGHDLKNRRFIYSFY